VTVSLGDIIYCIYIYFISCQQFFLETTEVKHEIRLSSHAGGGKILQNVLITSVPRAMASPDENGGIYDSNKILTRWWQRRGTDGNL